EGAVAVVPRSARGALDGAQQIARLRPSRTISRNSSKVSAAAATIFAVMRDPGQDSATGQPVFPPSIDWSALLARHDRWLRTAVFARLRELDGVDEVMQAVAVAAVEQAAPLLDLNKAAPWLYRLAVWQTLLYRRRAGRQRKLAGTYGRQLQANDAAQ